MNQQFNLFDVIVITGIIQGLISSVMLYFNPARSAVKKLTIALLLVMVLLSSKILLHTLGLWQLPVFRYFPLAIDTLFQPLIYLYALALTKRQDDLFKFRILHFVLPGLFIVHGLLVYFVTVFQADMAMKENIAARFFYDQVKWVEDVLAIVSGVFYWLLSFRRIQSYRKWLFENQSGTNYPELAWIRNLLISSGVFVLLLIIASLQANVFQINASFAYTQLFYFYLAFLIYFFAYHGRNQVLTGQWYLAEPESETGSEPSTIVRTETAIPFEAIRKEILRSLEEKQLFLDPGLSLKQLAAATGYPLAQVSATINQSFDQNFRNLINQYRVAEVKKRLGDKSFAHLSLTGIAMECGFNSEASFYRIFRKLDGDSPGNFQRSLNSQL